MTDATVTRHRTLPDLIDAQAAALEGKPALIEGEHAMSFAEVGNTSMRLAAGLAGLGIGRGDRVAVWLPNTIWWIVTLAALARLSALAMCVNTRFRSAEVGDILKRSGAVALVYEPGFKDIGFETILSEIEPEACAALQHIIACGTPRTTPEGLPDALPIGELCNANTCDFEAVSGDDGVVMFTTSGTTNRPKFVRHTQRSIVCHAQDVACGFGYDRSGAALLQALPLCGTFGLAQAMGGIAAGTTSVLMSAFNAAGAARLIPRHRITSFNATDEMVKRLLEPASAKNLTSVDWCGFACFNEARPAEFVKDAEARGLRLLGLYGMSEVQALYARQCERAPAEDRALAGGTPTSPHAAARVCDPESGRELPPGEAGELQLSGPSLFEDYYGNPDATASALTDDGFVRTGDLARMTDEHHFVFEQRMGDSMRLGGFLVNPAEIDAWIEQDASVHAAQTVAIDVGGRQRPVTFVIPETAGTLDEDRVIEHCRDGLAGFKVPARVIELDAFPATDGPNGRKIQRGALRDMALDHTNDEAG